jgi:hypothetical protein
MSSYRSVHVRDCLGILFQLYAELGEKAKASFEGDLAVLGLQELPGATFQATAGLKHQTLWPRQDFVVVPLHKENVVALKRILSQPGVLGRGGSVIHTQMASDGKLVFAACDNFDEHATFVSELVPDSVLDDLKAKGLIHGYSDN